MSTDIVFGIGLADPLLDSRVTIDCPAHSRDPGESADDIPRNPVYPFRGEPSHEPPNRKISKAQVRTQNPISPTHDAIFQHPKFARKFSLGSGRACHVFERVIAAAAGGIVQLRDVGGEIQKLINLGGQNIVIARVQA